jgi:ATP-binding cassette subfamily G (WHITE) protein 2 (PDR)
LLFLAKGGKTVYFGEIGNNSHTLLEYFENSGARKCGEDENPAEYMLEIVNNGKNDNGQDWHTVWKESDAAKLVQKQINEIHEQTKHSDLDIAEETGGTEFAMPLTTQIWECTYRVFQQYWRMPSYVLAKMALCTVAGLFIGFSFYGASNTQAGMQNIIFSVFMLTTIFSSLVQQVSHTNAIASRYAKTSRSNRSLSLSARCTRAESVLVKPTPGSPCMCFPIPEGGTKLTITLA